MNLLMTAPLLDSRGTLRYFIGAQIDVSGLVKDGTDLEAFQYMRQQQQEGGVINEPRDEFQELSKMFNNTELDIVRKHGGNMHREVLQDHDDNNSTTTNRPRVLIQDSSTFDHVEEGQKVNPNVDGKLSGPYKHVSCLINLGIANSILTIEPVSPRTPRTFSPHPFLLTVAPRARYPTVPLPRPHRRQYSCPRLRWQRTCRRIPRRHSQNPLVISCSLQPRRLV
jgi:hypothetical protein